MPWGDLVLLQGATILDQDTSNIQDLVKGLCDARKDQGMTAEKAEEHIRGDPSWYGTMMVLLGKAIYKCIYIIYNI